MKEQADGTFDVIYGRVGTAGTRMNYPIALWDRKLREKLRKGYQDMTHLFAMYKVTWKWEDITDTDVKSLMDRLLRYSKNSLSRNYLVSSTEVSLQQVESAQAILDELVVGWENGIEVSQMNDLLLSLYAIIPPKNGGRAGVFIRY